MREQEIVNQIPVLEGFAVSGPMTYVYGSPLWPLGRAVLRDLCNGARFLVAAKALKSHHAYSAGPEMNGSEVGAVIGRFGREVAVRGHRLVVARKPYKSLPDKFRVPGDDETYRAEKVYYDIGWERVPVWRCFLADGK